MKKTLFTILLFISTYIVYADPTEYTWDFSAESLSGQTLYYVITSDSTVKITFPGNRGIQQIRVGIYEQNYMITSDPYRYYEYYTIQPYNLGWLWSSHYERQLYDRPSGKLVIPDTVVHNNQVYKVTEIKSYAFYNCTGIDSLYIGKNIKRIENYAFKGCSGVNYLFFNAKNCQMGRYLLHHPNDTIAPYLSTVAIGDSVERIPQYAFCDCYSLTSVILDRHESVLNQIDSYAFGNCLGLSSFILPRTINVIGEHAFDGCINISFLHIPWHVTSIGDSAFGQVESICYTGNVSGAPWGANNVVVCPGSIGLIYSDSTRTFVVDYVGTDTSIIIPESVISIGQKVFKNYTQLCSILLPNTLQHIDDEAFYGCVRLKEISLPDSLIYIGKKAFYSCDSIQSIAITQSVSSIGEYAFAGCDRVTSIGVDTNNTYYDSRENCDAIIETSTNKLLQGCNSTIIPSSVASISSLAFWRCNELPSVTIPEGVDTIPYGTFMECSSIQRINIPNSVYVIGPLAFSGCGNIQSLSIGSSVDSIALDAFMGCDSIDTLSYNTPFITFIKNYLSEQSKQHISRLVVGNNVQVIPAYAFNEFTSLRYVEIGNGVVDIGNNAFFNDNNIDSIFIGSSVHTIGANAFSGCSGLKYLYYNAQNCNNDGDSALFSNTPTNMFSTLVIGDSVRNIPNRYFMNRTSLQSVTIPDGVVNIGSYVFSGCDGIDSLYIGSGTQSIGAGAFVGCFGLKYICYNARNCNDALFDTSANAPFYNTSTTLFNTLVIGDSVRNIPSNAFYNRSSVSSVLIGSNAQAIGNGAFQGCTGFRKLIIPRSVTSIGSNAFYGCTGIDSLYVGSDVQTIGSGAFRGCTGLQWLNYNAPNLPAQGFYGCTQLATLTLGNTVQSIGDNAFYDCDNLLTANVDASQIGGSAFANCDRLVSVTLGNSVETLGNSAFNGCFRLQNINLGGITSIGNNAFNGCVRLENPELPATLTTIGTHAFDGCSLLAGKLTFPANITNIGDYAYNGVGTITEIEMLGVTPPTIYAHTFASVSNTTPVSVPCGAVLSYYTTNYWENFSTIVEAPPYKLTVNTNNETMGSAAVTQQPTCSNHSAIIQATALSGFHFLQWSDGNGTNPRTIQMTQDSTFTAIFVANNSYIVVEPNDPTMGSTTGTGTYGYSAPVTMTATAYDGYHFLKWNDGNTQNPRYMAATRDTTFTAIFVSNVSTITVMNANPEWGNVGGSGVYYYQNLVSLTATPNYGYHFSQWQDGNTQNPRTIVINQDSTFTAYFAVNTYSIVATSNSTTMGSVTGGGTYTYLHEMSLTATAAYGYHFVQWNDQNTDNPRTITVTRDSAFTAQFAANRYTITAEPNDPTMGSAYGSGTYNYNSTVTLTAVETYGYHFTQWSDGVTDNPRIITVQNNATYTAQFAINSYILTVQSSNPAIGTTSGGGSYNYMTPVNITAIPNVGYHFTQWSDGNTDNPRLVTVVQNATYTAQFAINSYAVSVTCNNSSMGSVSGSGTYNHNTTATLTATAYYGYHFVQWQDGNTENPRSVVVTDSAQYTAQFDFNSYLITANSSNVTLGSATGGGSYNYLSQVALTAVPVPHYHFTMWNDSIEDNPRTTTVTRDSVFTAHFAIDRHTIAVHTADATQGTTSGSDTVDYNTAVWISATANYGYHFTQWQDGNASNPRRVVVSKDTVFTASFAPNQYTATCGVNDNSRGTVATTGGSYSYLTSVTFTAIPNGDYHFLKWSNGSTENPVTFTITRDTTFTAILVGLTANVNNSTMGTVTHSKPSNLVEVVTATANYGYHFVQWNDGVTDNPRTVILAGDSMLTAIFAVNNYYVTLASNDSTLGAVQGEGEYAYQSNVTITAVPVEHCHFVQWSDGNTSNPRVVTVTRDTSFTAVFERDPQYTITVVASDTAWGVVSGGGVYYAGETVVLTATARGEHHFVMWSDGNTQNPRSITVIGDASYTAVFEEGIGIADVELPTYRVYVRDSRIVVEGVESEKVQVFDITGRQHRNDERLPMGVYVVRVDRFKPIKCIVQ